MTWKVESDTFTSVCGSFQQGSVLFFENEASVSQRGIKRKQSGSK